MNDSNKPQPRRIEEVFPLLANNAPRQLKTVASLASDHEGNVALVIIDVQRQICDPEERGTDETVAIAKRIRSIVPAFRAAAVPVYAVYSNAIHEHDFFKFIPAESDTLVIKNYDSAFKATKLKELLEQEGKKLLLVCGFNRAACVMTSVVDARKTGFDVCLLKDLTGNDCWNAEADNNFAEQTLKYSGAVMTTSQDVLKHLKPGLRQ